MRAARGRNGRGPAGPPPPTSWLIDSMHTPAHLRRKKGIHSDTRARYERVDHLGGLPAQYFPDGHSLIHQTLKALAREWDWHIHYDQFYLATLPIRYKQTLLSYIAFYNPQRVTCHSLEVLFFDDSQLDGATGSETLTHLDLASSVGNPLGLKELKDIFTKKRPITHKTMITTNNDTIPDTWETPTLAPSPTLLRFPSLTHLSLAQPPFASWRSLLALCPHLTTLTHLSLASWPVPSLTPNAKTAFRTTPRGDVDCGGSNDYSLCDCDFSGSATVLRRLSRSLLCLKWLDVTGCGEWIRALGAETGVDWNGAWRGVETVVVGRGWVPDCLKDGSEWWRELWEDSGLEYWSSEKLALRRELKMWIEFEKNIKDVEQEVAYVIAHALRESSDEGGIAASRLPGTWWEYGSGSRPVVLKAGQRPCRVKFERGWDDWRIEDAVDEMTRSRRFGRENP